jgi:hypothetical protein
MSKENQLGKFIVESKGSYMVKWSAKTMSKDIKEAKAFNKSSADYIAKEINGKVIPV